MAIVLPKNLDELTRSHLNVLNRNNVDLNSINNSNISQTLNSLLDRHKKFYSKNYKLSIYRTLMHNQLIPNLTIPRRQLELTDRTNRLANPYSTFEEEYGLVKQEILALKYQALLNTMRIIWNSSSNEAITLMLSEGTLNAMLAIILGISVSVRLEVGSKIPTNGNVLLKLTYNDWQIISSNLKSKLTKQIGPSDKYVVVGDERFFRKYDVIKRINRILQMKRKYQEYLNTDTPLINCTHVTINSVLKRWAMEAVNIEENNNEENLRNRFVVAKLNIGLRSFLKMNRDIVISQLE